MLCRSSPRGQTLGLVSYLLWPITCNYFVVVVVQSGGLIAAGLGLAAIGVAGRYALRYAKQAKVAQEAFMKHLPGVSKYYRGGFETKMTKREASLVLGVTLVCHFTFSFIFFTRLNRLENVSPYM